MSYANDFEYYHLRFKVILRYLGIYSSHFAQKSKSFNHYIQFYMGSSTNSSHKRKDKFRKKRSLMFD